MLQSYDEALHWIHSRLRLGIKPGLKRMEYMLAKLDHPEKKIKTIHVGGTNGKGSTVTFLQSILAEAGYTVGTFTSPYIEQFNERISMNGQPISDEDMVRLVNVIKPLSDELEHTDLGAPTEFEVITAMALYYFGEITPIDFAVIEVGLGGRFDSTNVIEPMVSLITNIGMDHVAILGDTIEEIAFEKAGIIKDNTPIFTNSQDSMALQVFEKCANEKNAPLYHLGKEYTISEYEPCGGREVFTFSMGNITLEQVEISLIGRHQTENAAGAIAALLHLREEEILHISDENIRRGLVNAYWPARMEEVMTNPTVILDGAHNVEGIQAFKEAMTTHYPERKKKIVFAGLADKDLTHMFKELQQLDGTLYITQFDFPRAALVKDLSNTLSLESESVNIHEDWRELVIKLIKSASNQEVIAVTGSLYFISQIKAFLKEEYL